MRHWTQDCGCDAKAYSDSDVIDIEYCAIHRAAPDMLVALKAVTNILTTRMYTPGFEQLLNEWITQQAWPAVAKAEGKK